MNILYYEYPWCSTLFHVKSGLKTCMYSEVVLASMSMVGAFR